MKLSYFQKFEFLNKLLLYPLRSTCSKSIPVIFTSNYAELISKFIPEVLYGTVRQVWVACGDAVRANGPSPKNNHVLGSEFLLLYDVVFSFGHFKQHIRPKILVTVSFSSIRMARTSFVHLTSSVYNIANESLIVASVDSQLR
jgi:hypothetical protein